MSATVEAHVNDRFERALEPAPDGSNRSVLVTGGAGGIGSAVVRKFAAAGFDVAIHHHGQHETAAALADEVSRANGAATAIVDGDVADATTASSIVDDASDALGRRIDVLVNCAGILTEGGIVATPVDAWRRVIDINLIGTYLVTRAFLTRVGAGERGVVISVSSQLAFKGAPLTTAYSASKAGVVGLTRSLAREVGPDIGVFCVAPGPVATDLITPFADDDWIAARTESLISGRLATPDEIGDVCLLLSTDAGQLLQGQVIHCNGGGYLA